MMPNEEHNTANALLEGMQAPVYYCRGCGGPLPQGSSAHFHPECLKADKRRRIAERRQQEAQRFQKWIRRLQCPDCGANLEKLVQVNPQRSAGMAREASQGSSEAQNSREGLDGREVTTDPAARLQCEI